MPISRIVPAVLFVMVVGFLLVSNVHAESMCEYVLTQSKCPKGVSKLVCPEYSKALEEKYPYSSCIKARKSVLANLEGYQNDKKVTLPEHCRFMALGMWQTCTEGKKDYFK